MGDDRFSDIRNCASALQYSRATWIASKWKTDSEEAALPPRLNETWSDKFADQLPAVLWPKARIAYYVFGACVLTLVSIGLASMLAKMIHSWNGSVQLFSDTEIC